VRPRFEIFLKDNLSIADGLKHQLLIGHDVISGNRPTGRIELCLGRSQFVQSDYAAQSSAGSWSNFCDGYRCPSGVVIEIS
jgi:hypothetical protein